MRLFQLVALLVGSCAPGWCVPITYNIAFTLDPGSFVAHGGVPTQPVSGSFVYDAATTTFTNFRVDFYNRIWDLTQAANSPTGFEHCAGMPNNGASSFALLQQSLPCSPSAYGWWGVTGSQGNIITFYALLGGGPIPSISPGALPPIVGPGSQNTGGFTISEVPEPEAWATFLLGIAGLVFRRRSKF